MEEIKEEIVLVQKERSIQTLDDMTSFLCELQSKASNSLEEMIAAQLEVIRYIQSPTLVDSTLDSLLLHLDRSLKATDDFLLQEKLKENFSLMMQNYIFFFDARLQYSLDRNSEEAIDLFNTASECLVGAVEKTVNDLCVSDKENNGAVAKFNPAGTLVMNILTKTKDTGLFRKLGNVIKSKLEESKNKALFYNTIHRIFQKFDKHYPIIGSSMLISELIERYGNDLVTYKYQTQIDKLKKKMKSVYDSILSSVVVVSVISGIIMLIRWLGYGVISFFSDKDPSGWALSHLYTTAGIAGAIAVIIFLFNLSTFTKYAELKEEQEKFSDYIRGLVNRYSDY